MSYDDEEELLVKGRKAPDNLPRSFLLSAGYDGEEKKAFVRLYEPNSQEIYLWYDNLGHLPYLISKTPKEKLEKTTKVTTHRGFNHIEEVEKYDSLLDRKVTVNKIIADDPLSIGGSYSAIRNILKHCWESHIRYYNCYNYDNNLIPGMPYIVKDGELMRDNWDIPHMVKEEFEDVLNQTEPHLKETMREWARLLECPVPEIKRVAVDIEVRPSITNRLPNADLTTDPIIAVAFASSDGVRKVILLNDKGGEVDIPVIQGTNDVQIYTSEKKLIVDTFKLIDKYPVVLTFNGDDFDFKYLRNRARKLGIPDSENPITLGRRFAFLTNGVHIDLYQFFRNRSIQGYAFGNVYRENNLDAISNSILNQGKIEVGEIGSLSLGELGEYCMQDSYITYQLTAFNNNLVMNLMILLSRISKSILEDVSRLGVSRWILSMMEWEHRKEKWLIPNTIDIIETKGGTTTEAIIKGKKYQGGIVRDPTPGVHFEVTVLDFASLYPSAIRNWNLSYETLICPHNECKDNIIPGTQHWVCTKNTGMTSNLIGSLRDLRVLWYKPLSKDKKLTENDQQYYYVVQQALKVFLNASYGVFGAESFPLYCPPLAESTAAVGRYAMEEAQKKSEELDIEVLYGDTDSVFLNNPTKTQINKLVEWAHEKLGIDLEVEKTYRYAIFSKRKKNYLGVYKDGRLDIKGLTGKKRHIPLIQKKAFDELTNILSNVQSFSEFPQAKEKIRLLVEEVHRKLTERDFTIEEVAFQMQLGKNLSSYNTNPQHVKAGRMLKEIGHEIVAGDIINYVVTKDDVLPAELAKPKDVDIKKYEEYLENTFEQLLDALDMNFDVMIGRPQQTSLGKFFR